MFFRVQPNYSVEVVLCYGVVGVVTTTATTKSTTKLATLDALNSHLLTTTKMKLSKKKCHLIHVSKKSNNENVCTKLKIHDDEMQESSKQKYLGDIVDTSGKIRSTIEERKRKGYGIVAEILAIVNDIPLGKYKMEIGLKVEKSHVTEQPTFQK